MSGWGAQITGLSSTLRVLNDIGVNFDDDTVYVVGPTVEYAVNCMPHRPEIGRGQNEPVSGKRYATTERHMNRPYVNRVWHVRTQTARSSARGANAHYQGRSSTSTATATPSNQDVRSVAVVDSEFSKSTRFWIHRTEKSSVRSARHYFRQTQNTSTEIPPRRTASQPRVRNAERASITASTAQTASGKPPMVGTSQRGGGSARHASRSSPSTDGISTSAAGSLRSTASPVRRFGGTNHGAQMTASLGTSGGSSRRTGSWKGWSDAPTVGIRRSRRRVTTSSRSPTTARRRPTTSSRRVDPVIGQSTTRRLRSGTSGRTSTTRSGGKKSPTTSTVARQSRGNGQTARTVERRRERNGSDKRPRVARTRNRVKRYAELRGNSKNSGITSLLDNIIWYVDQGTSKMEARPFVQPAAERVQADLRGSVSEFLDGGVIDAGEEGTVRAAALAVQREMQRIITQKGAVDTGTMRSSVSVQRLR